MQITWTLGIIAALLHGTAYVLYNRQAKRGESKPNIVSWSIWAFMAGLNLFSFVQITSVAHALQYAVGTVAAILTFLLSLLWGKFDWPNKKEVVIFAICLIAVVVWKYTDDPSLANAILLIALLISFYPTFMGVYKNRSNERPFPWLIWTGACVVTIVNNLLSWEGRWMAIVNPVFLFVCHYSIAFLSRNSRR